MALFLLHRNQKGIANFLNQLHIPHGIRRPKWFSHEDVMILWGANKQAKSDDRTINSNESIAGAYNLPRVKRVLALHGMTCSPQLQSASFLNMQSIQMSNLSLQRYVVFVFELNVIAVYRRHIGTQTQFKPIDLTSPSRALRRLIQQAIKVVYSLGLDFAEVTLETQWQKTSHTVLGVNPVPHLINDVATHYAEAIARFEAETVLYQHQPNQAMIGMDPEFILAKSNGKIVSASQFVTRDGQVGYDGMRVKGKVVHPFVELRPLPSKEPRQIMIHLIQAMHLAAKHINKSDLAWMAGGMPKKGYRLGGHVHLSGIQLSSRLLRSLDNYLALPLAMIEAESSLQRRPRYGLLGDFRRQFHGGFEYRTLPSWIVTPVIAKGVIALVRLIADHHHQLSQMPLQNEQVQTHFYKGEKRALLRYVVKIWDELEQLPSYPSLSSYLHPLKEQIMGLKAWHEPFDFRRAWRIPPFNHQIKQ